MGGAGHGSVRKITFWHIVGHKLTLVSQFLLNFAADILPSRPRRAFKGVLCSPGWITRWRDRCQIHRDIYVYIHVYYISMGIWSKDMDIWIYGCIMHISSLNRPLMCPWRINCCLRELQSNKTIATRSFKPGEFWQNELFCGRQQDGGMQILEVCDKHIR